MFENRFQFILVNIILLSLIGLTWPGSSQADPSCNRTLTAKVVALDQALFYNRQAAVNPFGMIYALRHDVVNMATGLSEAEGGFLEYGNVALRDNKRPRPLTLRMNIGDCLYVEFENLLSDPKLDAEQPSTRSAGMHVTGMQLVTSILDDGSYVGVNPSSLVASGNSTSYKWYAQAEGTFLISSGPVPGGEGDGAALAMGLFGAVNVEPGYADYYRSQLTREELEWSLDIGNGNENPANPGHFGTGHPIINYDARYPFASFIVNNPQAGDTITVGINSYSFVENQCVLTSDSSTPCNTTETSLCQCTESLSACSTTEACEVNIPGQKKIGIGATNDETVANAVLILSLDYTARVNSVNPDQIDLMQMTAGTLSLAISGDAETNLRITNNTHKLAGYPIINILESAEIVHSDLRAIIYGIGPNAPNFEPGTYPPNPVIAPNAANLPSETFVGPQATTGNVKQDRPREEPFREFTEVFHDEIFAVQAYPQFEDPVLELTLACCRDGFAINYGSGGIGSEVISNRVGKGPMWNCNDCKYEEFFLTSWVVGDPAMVVDLPASASDPKALLGPEIATKALYPDDPSNVSHSYIGDHVKMRNLHAGPKEHHIFHLHSHQWLLTPDDDGSAYLDSQAIGPGSHYTYDMVFNGSGNRNQTPGDAIFHCHFYPHFAQGMWALWRNHDVFEEGTQLDVNGVPIENSRALPDGEIVAGTPIPALVPIPSLAMAPMPAPVHVEPIFHLASTEIPSDREIGSNIVVPDTDLKVCSGNNAISCTEDQICNDAGAGVCDVAGDPEIIALKNPGYPFFIAGEAGHRPPHPPLDTDFDGGLPRHVVTGGEASFPVLNRLDFRKVNETLEVKFIPEDGTDVEKVAMTFHEQRTHASLTPDGIPLYFVTNGLPPVAGAPYADPCVDDQGNAVGLDEYGNAARNYDVAGIQLNVVFNKVGEHYPQARMMSLWGDVDAFLSGAKPPEPLFFRANSRECIKYRLVNLVPGEYKLDDFQVRTPTDVIGQHIHLVKFDVTSSDGSANGFNYEDGAFSTDEVIERIHAINDVDVAAFNEALNVESGYLKAHPATSWPLVEKPHPYFGTPGAQTIVQRWYVDETMNLTGFDRTLRTVYTHDHFSPSTHQQVGYYAGLLVEPENSTWLDSGTGVAMGSRFDGGPTSWRANIELWDDPYTEEDESENSYREFMFEFADFALGYEPGPLGTTVSHNGVTIDAADNFVNPDLAINPPARAEVGLPTVQARPDVCPGGVLPPCPEGVSADDPGSFVVNYRNESILQRIRNPHPSQLLCIENGIGDTLMNTNECIVLAAECAGGTGTCQADYCESNSLLCLNAMGNVIEGSLEACADPLAVPGVTPCGGGGTCQFNPAGCQTDGLSGDSSHVFRSDLVRANPDLNTWNGQSLYPKLTPGMEDGDPFTPLMETYENDRVQLRFMVGAHEEGHVESFYGVKWLEEPNSKESGWRNAQMAGISEHFEFEISNLGAVKGHAANADYLYSFDTSADGFATGVWGLLRSYQGLREDLYPLSNNLYAKTPGNKDTTNSKEFSGVCPNYAPERNFSVWAVRAADVLPEGTLIYNQRPGTFPDHPGPLHDPTALMYVLSADIGSDGKLKPGVPVEPLILRAKAGDCIHITLTNKLPYNLEDPPHFSQVPMLIENFNTNEIQISNHVGLHPQLVTYDVLKSEGANIGFNVANEGERTARPGGPPIKYKWYAGDVRYEKVGDKYTRVATPIEFGATNLIPSDPIEHTAKGLIAALIIEPQYSLWETDPYSRAQATVTKFDSNNPDANVVEIFREFVVILQDDIQLRDSNFMTPGTCDTGAGTCSAGDEGAACVSDADCAVDHPFGQPICPIRGGAPCEGVEDAEDSGNKAVNYRTEPMWFRMGTYPPGADFETTRDKDFTSVLSNTQIGNFDPETPIFTAVKGTPVRFRLLQPGGHPRNGVFAVHGHIWQREPYVTTGNLGSEEIGNNPLSQYYGSQGGMGPMNHFDFVIKKAGGEFEVTGDYLWRNMSSFQFDGGHWGLFRVCDGEDQTCGTGGGGAPPACEEEIACPNVLGMSEASAKNAIKNKGLTPGSVKQGFSDDVPRGDVISQFPGATTMLACGTSVDLEVSDGPEPEPPPMCVDLKAAGESCSADNECCSNKCRGSAKKGKVCKM